VPLTGGTAGQGPLLEPPLPALSPTPPDAPAAPPEAPAAAPPSETPAAPPEVPAAAPPEAPTVPPEGPAAPPLEPPDPPAPPPVFPPAAPEPVEFPPHATMSPSRLNVTAQLGWRRDDLNVMRNSEAQHAPLSSVEDCPRHDSCATEPPSVATDPVQKLLRRAKTGALDRVPTDARRTCSSSVPMQTRSESFGRKSGRAYEDGSMRDAAATAAQRADAIAADCAPRARVCDAFGILHTGARVDNANLTSGTVDDPAATNESARQSLHAGGRATAVAVHRDLSGTRAIEVGALTLRAALGTAGEGRCRTQDRVTARVPTARVPTNGVRPAGTRVTAARVAAAVFTAAARLITSCSRGRDIAGASRAAAAALVSRLILAVVTSPTQTANQKNRKDSALHGSPRIIFRVLGETNNSGH